MIPQMLFKRFRAQTSKGFGKRLICVARARHINSALGIIVQNFITPLIRTRNKRTHSNNFGIGVIICVSVVRLASGQNHHGQRWKTNAPYRRNEAEHKVKQY
jgi:hypothetical protein